MKNSNTHYKSLFKATSLFGIVEVIRMLLKVVANIGASYFLGTANFGLVGLIENTTQLISSITNFGINFTGIREVAGFKDKNSLAFHKTLKIIHLFCLFSGILAAAISILGAYYLSFLTFDSYQYYFWFVLLSIYFVCTSGTQSKIIFLEGTQNFKKLIRINILVNIVNTLIILVAYYYFKVNGIVIAMVVNAFITYLLYYKLSGVQRVSVTVTNKEIKAQFKKLMQSGGLLSVNVVLGFLSLYIIRLYLKEIDLTVLSYYNAGLIILVSYLGIIFIAISKFFFPKLTQVIEEEGDFNLLINNQFEICLLLILPAILVLYLLGEFIIGILFSAAFKPVYQILIFGLAAIIFKGFNYSTGYLFLSNKNWKQYFYINAVSDFLNVILTIWLYHKMQLFGIGLALLVNYFLGAVYCYFYIRKKYAFSLTKANQFFLLFAVCATALIIVCFYTLNRQYFDIIALLFVIISLIYSIKRLDEYLLDSKILNKIKALF
ncbi:oligosaccharide flippase family protein [Flavobacterium sp. CBA20B-1]|uniref:lipid II flippase MurJ n=1 Tax=unclassified Flavobacterium TaxID=196869 RepID=UPI002225859C|nr:MULTISPECIES: lipid II flippase MurJ [unclassified Flavobacterium]WCM42477.1 oligosaccharide flippase family protein [Flavobacterium sp. CBA20B-1]